MACGLPLINYFDGRHLTGAPQGVSMSTDPSPWDGYNVLETPSEIRLVLACGVTGIGCFRRDRQLDAPGIYFAITRSGYVGRADVSVSARTGRMTTGGGMPDALLALVGGNKRFREGDARALERVAFQAYDQAGVPLRNGVYPEGEAVGHVRYAELQKFWAETLPALREVAPALACPWVGPDYLVPPEDEVEPLPTRWRGAMGAASASLRSTGSGYAVEAGSRLRLEPIPSAPGLCEVMREELAFAGVLVREHCCWRLTRDVYLPTLAACSKFVFTSSSNSYWRVVQDIDRPFEPGFGR